jgi:hypothetical protein
MLRMWVSKNDAVLKTMQFWISPSLSLSLYIYHITMSVKHWHPVQVLSPKQLGSGYGSAVRTQKRVAIFIISIRLFDWFNHPFLGVNNFDEQLTINLMAISSTKMGISIEFPLMEGTYDVPFNIWYSHQQFLIPMNTSWWDTGIPWTQTLLELCSPT